MEENGTNNGFDQSTMDLLEELKKEREQKKAEEETAKKRAAVYENLKKDEAYPILKEGGIDEMFEKNPAIFDSQAALQTAIQNATLKVQMKKLQESQQKQEEKPAQNSFNPATPNATPQSSERELTSTEFYDKMANGTATLEDLKNAKNIEYHTKVMLKKVLTKGIANNADTIAKGRAALGSE